MSRPTILAAALGVAALSTPATAEPLRVGFLGAELDRAAIGALSVDNMGFLDPATKPAASPKAAEMTTAAAAAVRQADAFGNGTRMRVFASNPFYEVPGRRKTSTVAVNYEAAAKAIDWFGRNEVKTVVIGFSGADTLGMRQLTDRAQKLGMVVVAPSRMDGDIDRAFPAAYMQTISVGMTPEGSIMSPTVMSRAESDVMNDLGRVTAVSAHLLATDPELHPAMLCFALTRAGSGPRPALSVDMASLSTGTGVAPAVGRGDARVMMASRDAGR